MSTDNELFDFGFTLVDENELERSESTRDWRLLVRVQMQLKIG